MRSATFGRLLWFGDRRTIALRQTTKAIEDVVGLPDGAGDLALEAISVGGRRYSISIKFALTGGNILCFLVGGRLIGASGRKRTRANESA
jgi:hypothetical protein